MAAVTAEAVRIHSAHPHMDSIQCTSTQTPQSGPPDAERRRGCEPSASESTCSGACRRASEADIGDRHRALRICSSCRRGGGGRKEWRYITCRSITALPLLPPPLPLEDSPSAAPSQPAAHTPVHSTHTRRQRARPRTTASVSSALRMAAETRGPWSANERATSSAASRSSSAGTGEGKLVAQRACASGDVGRITAATERAPSTTAPPRSRRRCRTTHGGRRRWTQRTRWLPHPPPPQPRGSHAASLAARPLRPTRCCACRRPWQQAPARQCRPARRPRAPPPSAAAAAYGCAPAAQLAAGMGAQSVCVSMFGIGGLPRAVDSKARRRRGRTLSQLRQAYLAAQRLHLPALGGDGGLRLGDAVSESTVDRRDVNNCGTGASDVRAPACARCRHAPHTVEQSAIAPGSSASQCRRISRNTALLSAASTVVSVARCAAM